MTVKTGEKYDIGYIKPYEPQKIPFEQSLYMEKVKDSSEDTKKWYEKVFEFAGKLGQGLYVGAQMGLDVYERFKLIERGQSEAFKQTQADTGRQIVILGQSIDKNLIYILGAILSIVMILVLLRK